MEKSEQIANASVEVMEIMKYAPLEVRLKFPNKYKKRIEEIAKNSNYKWKYDTSKKLCEQNLSDVTKRILALLYKEIYNVKEKVN